MGNLKTTVVTFTKAQCSAWVASCVDFGMTLMLVSLCGVWYGYATLIGAFTGGLVNCGINYRWVFHAFGLKKKYVALRYVFVWVGSIALNTFGTWRLTELAGINYVISKTIVAVLWLFCGIISCKANLYLRIRIWALRAKTYNF